MKLLANIFAVVFVTAVITLWLVALSSASADTAAIILTLVMCAVGVAAAVRQKP